MLLLAAILLMAVLSMCPDALPSIEFERSCRNLSFLLRRAYFEPGMDMLISPSTSELALRNVEARQMRGWACVVCRFSQDRFSYVQYCRSSRSGGGIR